MPRLLSLFVLPLVVLAVPACADDVQVAPARAPSPTAQVVLVQEPVDVQEVAAPQASGAPIETWAARHADAAKTLGAWAHENPEAAASIFKFDGGRPERCRAFVLWALRNRSEDVAAFTSLHPDWEWFDNHAAQNRLGIDRFVQWARLHAQAAGELVAYPSGLRWVGDHLYASEWRP